MRSVYAVQPHPPLALSSRRSTGLVAQLPAKIAALIARGSP